MANVTIQALPAATTPLTGAELVPLVQSGVTKQTAMTNALAKPYYAITAVETAASITPTNYSYPPANALRYGTNTTPGTTDMTTAIQNAITAAGTGSYRGEAFIPAGAYKITASLRAGTASSNARPIIICGDGQGTQIINAAPASTPTFAMNGASHFQIKNMLLTGNSANLNDGIVVDGTTNGVIRWNIENVVAQMAGRGIVLKNTNTGVIRDFKSWPDSNDASLTVAQTVTMTDVDHGIYLTGGYCHDISIYDADCFPRDSFKAGACGIYCDATGPSSNVRLFGGLFQGNAGDSRNGVYLKNCNSYHIHGAYHESSVVKIQNCNHGMVSNSSNGGVEGLIQLVSNCEGNQVIGCTVARLDIADSGCVNNVVIGGYYTTSITDAAAPNTRFIGVRNYGADRGGTPWTTVTYSASMTPSLLSGARFNIVPSNSTAFTINSPSSPIDGATIIIKIRNGTGGALGALTWDAQIKAQSTTQPATGFSITRQFTHDKSYDSGVLWIQTGADVTVAN